MGVGAYDRGMTRRSDATRIHGPMRGLAVQSPPFVARRAVLGALSLLDRLEIDYSQPIDLIVVAPGLDA